MIASWRPREVDNARQVDRNPSRPMNRTKITRRMMDALLRLGNAKGGVLRQDGAPRFRMNPRTAFALIDAGLAVYYVVAIDYPGGTKERTPEIAITVWGRLLLDAFRHGKKRGEGRFYR